MPKNAIILVISILFAVILWGSISLSEVYFATIEAPVSIIDFPKGYTTGTQLPEKVSLKVKGLGWKLISTKISADDEYKVSVHSDSGIKSLDLSANLPNNQWIISDLEVIELSPDTLTILVEKIYSKKVPIEHEFKLDFRPGYGLASGISLNPDSLVITGARSKIIPLTKIKIDSIAFYLLDKKIVKKINLPEIYAVSYSETDIQLTLDVQRIVDKVFENISIEIIDLPSDRDVILLPNKIGCSLRGGIDFLGKFKVEDLKAYVYYNDIVRDTVGSIIPSVDIPENTTLQFIKPERLRYVIRTY